MTLETLQPDPAWERQEHEREVQLFRSLRDQLTIRIWCGDWCKDCQAQLPGFGAALTAAGIDLEEVLTNPVEKADDGSKRGPGVSAYDIKYIPTIVIEADGREVARYVESEDEGRPLEVLTDQLADSVVAR